MRTTSHRGCIGIACKNIDICIVVLCAFMYVGSRDLDPIEEIRMEKKSEHQMETGMMILGLTVWLLWVRACCFEIEASVHSFENPTSPSQHIQPSGIRDFADFHILREAACAEDTI